VSVENIIKDPGRRRGLYNAKSFNFLYSPSLALHAGHGDQPRAA
jgi:hypothetical protein